MNKIIIKVISLILILYVFIVLKEEIYASSSLTFQIIDNTEKHEDKNCDHFYMIKLGDEIIIDKTRFYPGGDTYFTLEKPEGEYTLILGKDYTDSKGKRRTYIWWPGHPSDTMGWPSETNSDGIEDRIIKINTVCVSAKLADSIIIDSEAKSEKGEVGVLVAISIILGIGVVANGASSIAGVAAGISSSSDDSHTTKDNSTSNYEMIIYKDFGNKIKYDDESLYIFARIVQIKTDGEKVDRFDLTQNIEIYSSSNHIKVGQNHIDKTQKCASLNAIKGPQKRLPKKGVVSFKYMGPKGYFQNNVTFKLVGDPYIELQNENVYVLSKSKKSFKLPFNLVDFVDIVDISIKTIQQNSSFNVGYEKDKAGNYYIVATDNDFRDGFDKFFDTYSCEIIASNENEYYETSFSVVMCNEGLLPNFLNKEKEILAYKDENGDMINTLVAFSVGVWDENIKTLNIYSPQNLEIEVNDNEEIVNVIGLDYKLADIEKENTTILNFSAEKSFPGLKPLPAKLNSKCTYNDKVLENQTNISLVPDIIKYKEDFEIEFENCLRIINTYMPDRFRTKKIIELNKLKNNKVSPNDLRLFRETCWSIASRCVLQEKEDYMKESYWYDEQIEKLNVVVFIGDTAFDIALAPFGGPLVGFVLTQVKGSVLDMISMYIEKPSLGPTEVWEFIDKRYAQMVGQVDGVIEMPSVEEPHKLAAWLSIYTMYRIFYHWWYDKDDHGKDIGIVVAIEKGLTDFVGKGSGVLLAGFVNQAVKARGLDTHSFTGEDQALTNELVGRGLNQLDNLAEKADDATEKAVKLLVEFIENIKSGNISL